MTDRHPATQHLLDIFEYQHLPPRLQEVSIPFNALAHSMADRLQDGPELSTGLRKLVEAKDCFVRQAVLDAKAESVDVPANTPEPFLTTPDEPRPTDLPGVQPGR